MSRNRWSRVGLGMMAALMLVVGMPLSVVHAAEPFADPAFRAVWDRSDGPVAASKVQRTFLWGPAPLSAAMQEKYAQSPGGTRLVQYFDKSRMEITDPNAPQTSPFFVTN